MPLKRLLSPPYFFFSTVNLKNLFRFLRSDNNKSTKSSIHQSGNDFAYLPTQWPSPTGRFPPAAGAEFRFFHGVWRRPPRKRCVCCLPNSPVPPVNNNNIRVNNGISDGGCGRSIGMYGKVVRWVDGLILIGNGRLNCSEDVVHIEHLLRQEKHTCM